MVIPSEGYLAEAQKLLHKHNALLIADEVQTGLCRTGMSNSRWFWTVVQWPLGHSLMHMMLVSG